MLKTSFVLFALFFTLAAHALDFPFVPDGTMTTGSYCQPGSPDFKGYRYAERIAHCRRNVEGNRKAEVYRRYGVGPHCAGQYIIDHFIPLSMGGTNEINNLWPEANSVRNLRRDLEQDTFNRLSAGEITRAEAVQIIVDAKLHPPVVNPSGFQFCR